MLDELKRLEAVIDDQIKGKAEINQEDLEALARLLKALRNMCSNNAYICSFK